MSTYGNLLVHFELKYVVGEDDNWEAVHVILKCRMLMYYAKIGGESVELSNYVAMMSSQPLPLYKSNGTSLFVLAAVSRNCRSFTYDHGERIHQEDVTEHSENSQSNQTMT